MKKRIILKAHLKNTVSSRNCRKKHVFQKMCKASAHLLIMALILPHLIITGEAEGFSHAGKGLDPVSGEMIILNTLLYSAQTSILLGTPQEINLLTTYNSTKNYDFNPKVLKILLEFMEEKEGALEERIKWLAKELEKGMDMSVGKKVVLKNGTKFPAFDTNRETYAIQRVLGLLTDDTNTLNLWISKGKGSFYKKYTDAFEDPVLKEMKIRVKIYSKEPFLQKPFEYDNFCGITSFFDHQYPIYTAEEQSVNDSILLFTGKQYEPAKSTTCTQGMSCYSGHSGYDYLIRDCDTREGKEILAAASGVVEKMLYDQIDMGNVVYLQHDSDNDGEWDYRTRYMHLSSFREDLKEGDSVSEGEILGIAGTTGSSTGVHLHFDIAHINYYEDGTQAGTSLIDPYGWWEGSNDPWGNYDENAESAFLWETDMLIDESDAGFEAFNRSGYEWQKAGNGYGNGESLWNTTSVYEKDDPKWNAWAFWAGNIPEQGEYTVKAYIPEIGQELASSAKYRIYHIGGFDEKEINQEANQGSWMDLGKFYFEAGAHTAVLLTDEGSEGGRIVADAIKFEADAILNPELSFADVRIVEKETDVYEIIFSLQNSGDADAENIYVCFTDCFSQTGIDVLAAGTTEERKIKLFHYILPEGDEIGKIFIQSQYPEDRDTSNNEFLLTREMLTDISDPSEVDFSRIDLSGIWLASSDIEFLLQGESDPSGTEEIDISRDLTEKIFLTALAITNDQQWVSLGQGEVYIESPMEETDLGRIMLEADLNLKHDFAETMIPEMEELYTQWKNMLTGSQYWAEMQSRRFNSYPYFQGSIVIEPEETAVNMNEEQIFINEALLNVNAPLDYFHIDIAQYYFREEIENEINGFLSQWEESVRSTIDSVVSELTTKINTDEQYRTLQQIYPIMALAHWYKTQENSAYENIIDSNNIDGLESEEPFDEEYWKEQSWQYLGSFNLPSYYGAMYTAYWYGGVGLDLAYPESEGDITENQQNIFEEVLGNYQYVQEQDTYYFHGGAISRPMTDLTGSLKLNVENPFPGQNIEIGISIINSGAEPSPSSFQYQLYETITDENGAQNTYMIEKVMLGGLGSFSVYDHIVNYTIPAIVGEHKFFLEMDIQNSVSESNEENNRFTKKLKLFSAYPEAKILAPENGSLSATQNVTFYGAGEDGQDGKVADDALSWESDADGFLGTGQSLEIPSLSEGQHTITLTVTDSDGFQGQDSIIITVPEPGLPEVQILSPMENERFPNKKEIILSGKAVDFEDGELFGSQLIWESDVDGMLGTGTWLAVDSLQIGEHAITLNVIDFDGNMASEAIPIIIENGEPTLTLTSPVNGAGFFEHETVRLNAEASDLQDGDIRQSIEWYSNKDDFLGYGVELEVTFSPGNHRIQASIIDSDGRKTEEEVEITVQYTPPEITLLSPQEEAEYDYFEEMVFEAEAIDYQDGILGDEAFTWKSDLNGYVGQGKKFTLSKISPGEHQITLTVQDSDGATSKITVPISIILDQPVATIFAPDDQSEHYEGFPVTFHGEAQDQKEGMLNEDSLVWHSSIDGAFGTGESVTISNLSDGAHEIELRATDSDGWIGTDTRTIEIRQHHFPEISLIRPVEGETFIHGDMIRFQADAIDEEDGPLDGGSVVWSSDRDGSFGTGKIMETSDLSMGRHTITVTATDSIGAQTNASVHIEIFNRPPEIEIIMPAELNNIFVQNQEIIMQASVSDLEDESIPDESIQWNSNINGFLGTGESMEIPANMLDIGTHTIEAIVIDSGELSGRDEIILRIAAIGSYILEAFSDGETLEKIEFPDQGGEENLEIMLQAQAEVVNAQINITGKEVQGWTLNTEGGPYAGGISKATPTFVDIDNDNDLDLFIGNKKGKMKFYRNEGNGSDWTLMSEDYEGMSEYGLYTDPTFTDIDNDNDFDLFVGKDDGTINFYRNIGTAEIPEWSLETQKYLDIDVGSWAVPRFVDIDNDQDQDLIIGEYYGNGHFYRNDGNQENPLWTRVEDHGFELRLIASNPSFVDIDNDGDFDFFLGSQFSQIHFYRNEGSAEEAVWVHETNDYISFQIEKTYADTYPALTFADFDGDGDQDFFIGDFDGNINVYRNDGTAEEAEWMKMTEPFLYIDVGHYSNPAFVDIDADGDYDLVVGEEQNSYRYANETLNFYQNEGKLSLIEKNFATDVEMNIQNPDPVFIDIDSDDDFDLFIGDDLGKIMFYENIGEKFDPEWEFISEKYENIDVGTYARPTFVDIDNDQDQDLFVGAWDGSIYFYRNDGTMTSPEWTKITENYIDTQINRSILAPVFTDIDEDGDFDLFIGNYRSIHWYRNDGSPENAVWTKITENYQNLEIGTPMPIFIDIDHDGDKDIFIGDTEGGLSRLDQVAPMNPSLSVGGDLQWSYEGEFMEKETTANFSDKINEFLEENSQDENGNIHIPLIFYSDSAGMLEIDNVNIQYTISDTEAPKFGEIGVAMKSAGVAVPNPVYAGEVIEINVQVTDNQGIASVDAEMNEYITTLTKQESDIYSGSIFAPNDPGIYQLTVTATDISGIGASMTEELKVIVQGSRLVITSMTLSDDHPDEGEEVTISAEIQNFGDSAVSFIADVVADETLIAKTESIYIEGGASQEISWNWVAEYGMHTIMIELDNQEAREEKTINVRDMTPPEILNITIPETGWVDRSMSIELEAYDNGEIVSVEALINEQKFDLQHNDETQRYEATLPMFPEGSYETIFSVIDKNGLVTVQNRTFTIFDILADLQIVSESITIYPENPKEGEEITVTVPVKNTGRVSVANVRIQMKIDGEENEEHERYLTIAGGAENEVNFTFEASLGSHYLDILIDPENIEEEIHEINNTASRIVSIKNFDMIAISNVTLPEYLIEESPFLLQVQLAGEEERAEVFAETAYQSIPLIRNGNTGLYEEELSFPEYGEQSLTIKAMKNEGTAYTHINTLQIHALLPDITVQTNELAFSNYSPETEETIEIALPIKNIGGETVEDMNVRFIVDGKEKGEINTKIEAGEEKIATFQWTAEYGKHNLVFMLDPDNTITEFNEDNNMISKTINIKDTSPPHLLTVLHDFRIFEGGSTLIQVAATDNVEVLAVHAEIDNSSAELVWHDEAGYYEGTLEVPEGSEEHLNVIVEDQVGMRTQMRKRIDIYPILPDITLDTSDISVDSVIEGKETVVRAYIHNNGGTDTGAFAVQLEINSEMKDSKIISLKAGGSEVVELIYIPPYGEHQLKIITDASNDVDEGENEGNNRQTATWYGVDNTFPDRPEPRANPATWSEIPDFTISWDEVTDAEGIDEYLYRIDNGEWTTNASNLSVTLTDIEEGAHRIEVIAKDISGNRSEAGETYVYVDNSPPETPVVRERHTGRQWNSHTSPYFKWETPIDNGSGIKAYTVSLDGEEEEIIDLFYHSDLTSDIHIFQVKAIDQLGHESDWSDPITVQIDAEAPGQIEIHSGTHPDQNIATDNNTPKFTWIAPNDVSGILGYYYLFTPLPDSVPDIYSSWIENQEENNLVIDHLNSIFNPEGMEIPDGTWYLHLIAKDHAGNISDEVSRYQVMIKTSASTIRLIHPNIPIQKPSFLDPGVMQNRKRWLEYFQ